MAIFPPRKLYYVGSVQDLKDILLVAQQGDIGWAPYNGSLLSFLGANGGVHVGYEVIAQFPVANPPAATNAYGTIKAIPASSFPTRVDNSGGTSGGQTIGPVTDIASAANAVATLQAEIAQLRAMMIGAGSII